MMTGWMYGYTRTLGGYVCSRRGEAGVVKPRLINNGKDGTRLVFVYTGVDPPRRGGRVGVCDTEAYG